MHGLAVGQTVQVSDVSDATFDGTFEIATVPSTTTFTYLQAGDDVGATTAGTGTIFPRSYPARTVDVAGASGTGVMADLWSIRRMFYSDQWPLWPWTADQYETTEQLFDTASAGTPTNYYFDGDFIFLYPTPSSQFNISVRYIRRHSAITGAGSTSSDLIVPGEHHMQVYADGAIWMLRHGVVDPAALAGSPQFSSTMVRMLASAPNKYDLLDTSSNQIGTRPGMFPNDRHIVVTGDGGFLIGNEVSL